MKLKRLDSAPKKEAPNPKPQTQTTAPTKREPVEIEFGSDFTMDDLIATQDEVLTYLTACMRGEIQEERAMTKNLPGVAAGQVIKRIKTQVTPKDRNKAAELLAKRYGLLNDRVLLDGVQQVVFKGEENIKD